MDAYEYGEPPLVPMMVPQRIQLSAVNGAEDTAFSSQYNPMKVPDTIRLDDNQPPVPPTYEANVDFGRAGPARQLYGEQAVKEEPLVQAPPPQPVETAEAPSPEVDELSRQMQSLEQRVQKLERAVAGLNQPTQLGLSSFWYMLTFAGWMMFPLVVVYLFRSKRS